MYFTNIFEVMISWSTHQASLYTFILYLCVLCCFMHIKLDDKHLTTLL